MKILTLSSLFISLFVVASCSSSKNEPDANDQTAQLPEIVVSLAEPFRDISDDYICFNINAVLIESWVDSRFTAVGSDLHTGRVRFPGGTVSDYWDWQKGGIITDFSNLEDVPGQYLHDDRVLNYQNAKLTEFKTALSLIGSKAVFVLNILTSNLDDQLAMLREAENIGIQIDRVQIGNESYFNLVDNVNRFPSPLDYAEMADEWAVAIKNEFPNARVAAIGVNPNINRNSRLTTWNESLMTRSDNFDTVAFNIYFKSAIDELPNTVSSFPYFEQSDVPSILARPFAEWRDIVEDPLFSEISENKSIWITEYNIAQRNNKLAGSWLHGLHSAVMSLLFLETPTIEVACHHAMVSNSIFGASFGDSTYLGGPMFLGPDEEIIVEPYALSASGSALKLVNSAIARSTKARPVVFSNNPLIDSDHDDQFGALYGWSFESDDMRETIVLNLSSTELRATLSGNFTPNIEQQSLFAEPRALVIDGSRVSYTDDIITNVVAFPPYSVTRLTESL